MTTNPVVIKSIKRCNTWIDLESQISTENCHKSQVLWQVTKAQNHCHYINQYRTTVVTSTCTYYLLSNPFYKRSRNAAYDVNNEILLFFWWWRQEWHIWQLLTLKIGPQFIVIGTQPKMTITQQHLWLFCESWRLLSHESLKLLMKPFRWRCVMIT